MIDRMMTKLAYSRVLTERFQAIHLVANYSLLGLTLVAYLIFNLPEWVIPVSAIPGATIFFVSVQALSYRKAIEGDTLDLLNNFIR